MDRKCFPGLGATIALLLLFLLPGWQQSNAQRFTALKLPKALTAGKTPLKAASLSTNVLLNEDFENTSGSDVTYPLPDGWTATAANDVAWHSGSVVMDNNLIIGKSGDMYAYLIINNQTGSDAWAMSPKFRLEAGTEYVVRFWVMLFGIDEKVVQSYFDKMDPAQMKSAKRFTKFPPNTRNIRFNTYVKCLSISQLKNMLRIFRKVKRVSALRYVLPMYSKVISGQMSQKMFLLWSYCAAEEEKREAIK